ncbi:MAG: prepilin-type N-terminal cleavage/methylation domain-containing protein, partial [Planctomycetes bacterium]|nr:prepilin-type N-terminal cleavage/methylation domain-containing protein [Planctomycetota bacterium]
MGRERAFTLIELLVALALAMMISAAVTFIASQAQKIYTDTTAKVGLYGNVRYALDVMETEVPNMVATADL